MPKNLVILKDIDGHPMPIGDEPLDLGTFDVAKGANLEFYIRNENDSVIADISHFHTESNNSSFQGPKEVQPLETIKCSIKILASDDINLDNFDMDHLEIPSSNDRLTGEIIWKRF